MLMTLMNCDGSDDGEDDRDDRDDREEDSRSLARGMPEECSIAGGNNERYNGLAQLRPGISRD